jgi:hypothetical protein
MPCKEITACSCTLFTKLAKAQYDFVHICYMAAYRSQKHTLSVKKGRNTGKHVERKQSWRILRQCPVQAMAFLPKLLIDRLVQQPFFWLLSWAGSAMARLLATSLGSSLMLSRITFSCSLVVCVGKLSFDAFSVRIIWNGKSFLSALLFYRRCRFRFFFNDTSRSKYHSWRHFEQNIICFLSSSFLKKRNRKDDYSFSCRFLGLWSFVSHVKERTYIRIILQHRNGGRGWLRVGSYCYCLGLGESK